MVYLFFTLLLFHYSSASASEMQKLSPIERLPDEVLAPILYQAPPYLPLRLVNKQLCRVISTKPLFEIIKTFSKRKDFKEDLESAFLYSILNLVFKFELNPEDLPQIVKKYPHAYGLGFKYDSLKYIIDKSKLEEYCKNIQEYREYTGNEDGCIQLADMKQYIEQLEYNEETGIIEKYIDHYLYESAKYSQRTNAFTQYLNTFSNLTCLALNTEPKELNNLPCITHLKTLDLEDLDLKDIGFLSQAANLKELSLKEDSDYLQGLNPLVPIISTLKKLNLSCKTAYSIDLSFLQHATNLDELDLSCPVTSDQNFSHLIGLIKRGKLRKLSLAKCSGFTEDMNCELQDTASALEFPHFLKMTLPSIIDYSKLNDVLFELERDLDRAQARPSDDYPDDYSEDGYGPSKYNANDEIEWRRRNLE